MLVPLSDIFEIKNGTSLEFLNCDEADNGIPFISRTSANNGLVARIHELEQAPLSAGCITVALGGSVLSSFYQTEPFYTSFHIQCLYPKKVLSADEMLYYCAAIEANKYRYNYGRQANKTLKNIKVPSLVGMREQTSQLVKKSLAVEAVDKVWMPLKTDAWQWFQYAELFEIYTSKDENLVDASAGKTPYISSTQFQNGVSQRINEEGTHDSGLITVARNGSVGAAFFQPQPFLASPDDIRIFKPKFAMNQYSGIFLTTLIEKEKYRYAYGRKFGTKRMKASKIKLPATPEGLPDWAFMERCIKSLPYSSNL
jgi:Type I restriction modification DNA specificity domain